MAEIARSDSSSPDTDKDFEPTADMLVHEYDDERTLDEEEANTSGDSCSGELDDLQKESEMPIEELLAQYATGTAGLEDLANSRSTSSSSSEEEILESQNLTLDKEVISRDLLKNGSSNDDRDISVNDLIHHVSGSQTERLLRSTSHAESEESESSSEDESYEPVEEHKKTIQVGSDFQAVIPVGLSTYDDAPAYENEDRLLWDPSKIKDENALNDYLSNVQQEVDRKLNSVASIPRGKHIRDDEQALFLLLQCDNNIEEAVRRRKMQAVPPTDVMSLWSEEECRNFEDGLRLYRKNFHEIHQNKVRTRSVFELVHFYYLWKKTERHDVFAAKTRAEKRKYSINPGVTDHMDRFLEEQEVELSQAMIPSASDFKMPESPDFDSRLLEDTFSTGKTTVHSSNRHVDRSPVKSEQITSSSSKRTFSSLSDVNGSSSNSSHFQNNDLSSPKKQKTDNTTSHQSPLKKTRPDDPSEAADKNDICHGVRSSSPLPPSLPPPALCNPTIDPETAAQTGKEPMHITSNNILSSTTICTSSLPSPSKSAAASINTSKTMDGIHVPRDSSSMCIATSSSLHHPSTSSSAGKLLSASSGDSLSSDIGPCLGSEVSAV